MGLSRIREGFHQIFLPLQGFIGICRLESSAIHKDLSAYPGASLMRWMPELLLTSISRLSMAIKRLYRHRDDDDGFRGYRSDGSFQIQNFGQDVDRQIEPNE